MDGWVVDNKQIGQTYSQESFANSRQIKPCLGGLEVMYLSMWEITNWLSCREGFAQMHMHVPSYYLSRPDRKISAHPGTFCRNKGPSKCTVLCFALILSDSSPGEIWFSLAIYSHLLFLPNFLPKPTSRNRGCLSELALAYEKADALRLTFG